MQFLKKKKVVIPLSVILLLVLIGYVPKLAGAIIMLGTLGGGIYLYTKSAKFKSYNKLIKSLITAGLIFLFIFGIGGVCYNPQVAEQQRLAAEKAKIEKQHSEQREKEEQAKKEADDKIKKQAEEATKKDEEAKKLEAEAKKKADEEAAKKAEQEKANAVTQNNNSGQASTAPQQNSNTENNSSNEQIESNAEKQPSGEVVITNKGKKYHKASCRTVKQVKSTVSKDEAESMGYGPCGVCHP